MDREVPSPSSPLPDGVAEEIGRGGLEWTPDPRGPETPRPAASVMLLRDGRAGLEVLMTRRTEMARVIPGFWVFPGGALDECDRDGSADGSADGFAALRACAARELAEEVGIAVAADHELVPFARWITPEAVSDRFDASFFLALEPADAEARPDGREAVEARWIEPAGALAAHQRGEMDLILPTIAQLRGLAGFGSARQALESRRDRELEPVLPKPVETPDGIRISLPGDPDYPA